MRPHSGAMAALLRAKRVLTFGRVDLENPDGVMTDLTTLFGINWFNEATWTEGIDQPVASGQLTLHREHHTPTVTHSLAPTIGGSLINRNAANAYAPFLREGQRIKLYGAFLAPGSVPASGDWTELFTGYTDEIEWGGQSPLARITFRDLGARVIDAEIEDPHTFGGVTTTMEQVLQAMLDLVFPGVYTLYTPVSPSVIVPAYLQEPIKLMEAMRNVALSIGWDFRWKYDSAGVSRPTLYQPARTKTTPDAAFGPGEYRDLPVLKKSAVDVRNRLRVLYTKASTGLPASILREDITSRNKYGPKFMEISFDKYSPINEDSEAITLADTILSDVATPYSDQETVLFPAPFWPAQLGDLYRYEVNALQYDSPQDLAVVSFTHRLSTGSGETRTQSRGKVAGAHHEWIRRGDAGRPPILPIIREKASDTATTGTLDLEVEDPQGRMLLLESRTKAGTANWTGWTNHGTGPATINVGLLEGNTSKVEYHWRYIGPSGAIANASNIVSFNVGDTPGTAELQYSVDYGTGNLRVTVSGDDDTLSVRAVRKVGSEPTLAEIRAGSLLNGRLVTFDPLGAALAEGDHFYIGVLMYSGAGATGTESVPTRADDLYQAGPYLSVTTALDATNLVVTLISSSSIEYSTGATGPPGYGWTLLAGTNPHVVTLPRNPVDSGGAYTRSFRVIKDAQSITETVIVPDKERPVTAATGSPSGTPVDGALWLRYTP